MARAGFGRQSVGSAVQGLATNTLGQLGPIFTLSPVAKYITGARTVIKVNGKPVVFAFQVSWTVTTDQVEINTIDDPLPHEIAPRRITVSGTLGGFVIPGQSATTEVIQSNVLSFLSNKYISIEVVDSQTQSILFKTNSAVVTNCSTTSNAGQPATMTLQWKAIGWQNEFAPETPEPFKEDTSQSAGKSSLKIFNPFS